MTDLSREDIRVLTEAGWNSFRISCPEDHLALRGTLPVYTPRVAARFADGRLDVLVSVAAMLQRLDPTNGDLPILHAAANALRRKTAPPSQGPGKGRAARWSVPVEDLPDQQVAQVAGYDRAALAAFRGELDDRGLAAGSIARSMRDCLRLGALFGIDERLARHIRAEMNAAMREAKRQPSKRKADFRAAPLTPLDYARKARDVSRQAHACTAGRQTRHRLFLTAAILAFLSWMPDRTGDLVKLVIGRDIARTTKGWHLDAQANKTGFDLTLPLLPDALTPYLDDLVLLGADPGFGGKVLDGLYRQRVAMQSPLLARIGLDRAYSPVRVFELVRAATGHGPNAARKSMPDYCAAEGMPIEDAMALLGHRSRATTEDHYEVLADRHRRAHTQETLSGLRRDLLGTGETTDGTFRPPDGRLVDLSRINRALRQEDARRRARGT